MCPEEVSDSFQVHSYQRLQGWLPWEEYEILGRGEPGLTLSDCWTARPDRKKTGHKGGQGLEMDSLILQLCGHL